jgi:hypothetical protein
MKKKFFNLVIYLFFLDFEVQFELKVEILLNSNFYYLPITSACEFELKNHESSPNFPILYLDLKSFGNPEMTPGRRSLIILV